MRICCIMISDRSCRSDLRLRLGRIFWRTYSNTFCRHSCFFSLLCSCSDLSIIFLFCSVLFLICSVLFLYFALLCSTLFFSTLLVLLCCTLFSSLLCSFLFCSIMFCSFRSVLLCFVYFWSAASPFSWNILRPKCACPSTCSLCGNVRVRPTGLVIAPLTS